MPAPRLLPRIAKGFVVLTVGAYIGDVLIRPAFVARDARAAADARGKPLLNLGAGTPRSSLRVMLLGPTLWGDVNLVGSPSVPMLFWVTDVNAEGRISGYAMPSPLMRAMGPRGEPVQMPPLFPAVNVPYDPHKRRKLTWHTFVDARTAMVEAAREAVENATVADVEEAAAMADKAGDTEAAQTLRERAAEMRDNPPEDAAAEGDALHLCCGLPADGAHAQVCPMALTPEPEGEDA